LYSKDELHVLDLLIYGYACLKCDIIDGELWKIYYTIAGNSQKLYSIEEKKVF
jgi:hypothetical protein